MCKPGMDKIRIAKQNGSWENLDGIDDEITIPEDLQYALEKNKKAKVNFNKFSLSSKKQYLWWLKSAKRSETREKRIREIVRRAAENVKPGI